MAALAGGVYYFLTRTQATCSDGIQNQGEIEIDCGGPCDSCDVKNRKPLAASEPTIFWIDNNTLSLLFTVENPNQNYGSDNFTYKINLYDDHDNMVKSIQKSFFIYGGETETLTEINIDTGGILIGRAEVLIGDTNWVPSINWQEPKLNPESLMATKENGPYMVKGTIENPNSFDISQIVISAVLFSKEGREITVTRSDPGAIKPFRTKGFIVFVKIDPSMERYLDLSATKFYIDARR